MNELFNLIGQYQQVYDYLTDPDTDEQVVNDTLEGLMGEIEVNASQLVPMLNRLDMEIEACKKQVSEWTARKKVRENAQVRLKNMIMVAMDALGVKELEAGDVKFKLQNVGGQLAIEYVDGVTVPEKYTKLTIETDNSLVRAALDAGEELSFAHFAPRGRTLKIK